jgi:hypothetical protein
LPLLEDLLLRFRRVWAPPGPAAGQAGVPEDQAATIEDELRDLSGELAEIELRGQDVLSRAQVESAAIASSAAAEAASLIETARLRAPRARAERAARRVRDRGDEIQHLLARATDDARALREDAESRMGPLVEQVVEGVFASASGSEARDARVVGRR